MLSYVELPEDKPGGKTSPPIDESSLPRLRQVLRVSGGLLRLQNLLNLFAASNGF